MLIKVLHLTTHLNTGGISSYVLESGTALTKRGHEVSVLSSGGELEEIFLDKNLKVFKFPIRTKNALSLKIFLALPPIITLVQKEKFDLLHAHTRVTQVLASFVSLFTGVPFISTAHGFYRRRLGRKIFPSWGKRVVAISPLVAQELEKTHRVSPARIRLILNAINIPEYRKKLMEKNPTQVRVQLNIPEKSFVVGSISRLVKDKGHEFLVEAVARLKKKQPNIFLLIVGDGREKGPLEKLIKKRGLTGQARLIPSTLDITEVLSILDVFVHPATFREGFGLAMLEAMVAKVPVIATNIWAINSIIRDHINGFLVEPKSAITIEKALQEVIEKPELAGSIAENAYAMAIQAYSIDRMAAELETVYGETVVSRK